MQLILVNFAIELKENILSVMYVSEIAEVLCLLNYVRSKCIAQFPP